MDNHRYSSKELYYVLNHVFLPPQLPQEADSDVQPNPGDIALCRLALATADEFRQYLSEQQKSSWAAVIKMLEHFLYTTEAVRKPDHVEDVVNLADGGALVFHIRAQNAGLIIRRSSDRVVFEAFEVSPPPADVMEAEGKLLCSYPGSAVEIPFSISQDPSFAEQLVNFIMHMDVDQLDSAATTTKAGSTVQETRGTTNPKYISQLLIAILHGMGHDADVGRFTKRIADEVCWHNARNPWRRSPLWLVLRVAIQRISKSRKVYKAWMLFFHSQLLHRFLSHNISSDLLYTTMVKTARRAYKLGTSVPALLLRTVTDVCQEVQQSLQARWSKEQRLQSFSPSYSPNPSAVQNDTELLLSNSRDYLSRVLHPVPCTGNSVMFHPKCEEPRLRHVDISSIHFNLLTDRVKTDPYTALTDFEYLVEERLDSWVNEHDTDRMAPKILKSWLDQYISATATHYMSNPEEQSTMLLTILNLWVALDKVVCSQYPLLRRYSPEIPESFLDPLLLRHSKSLNRATTIQRYLQHRYSNADKQSTSIYSADITPTTFAVRCYEDSPSLQSLMSSIEERASEIRAEKLLQLHNLNTEHETLLGRIAKLDCQYVKVTDQSGKPVSEHRKKSCNKCKLQKQANSMRIEVHEWPLSRILLEAKATVFEMDCPPGFSIWRDMTYQILRDIGMAHINAKPTTFYPLATYDGLKTSSKKQKGKKLGKSGRMAFASETKSFQVAHYRNVKIPTTEGNVCVNNGFNFKLYDTVKKEQAYSSFEINVSSCCTLQLSNDANNLYRHLQHVVAHTNHNHNATIVDQSDCPVNLSIHEQLAFSGLRCGPQLQWMNIARELRTRTLTFSRYEVHALFIQAAWQMGPLGQNGSIWHTELVLADFGSVLIHEASNLLSHVEHNWMEVNTVKTIVYIITRLLASATDRQIHQMGYELLRKARAITHRWMREVLHKLQSVVGNERSDSISLLQKQTCEMAISCRATYDVDAGPHLRALLSSSADFSVLIECSIVLHDNMPQLSHIHVDPFQNLLRRDRRLSISLESSLVDHVLNDGRGLDNAITSLWHSYQAGIDGWQRLPEPNLRWLRTFTNPTTNGRAQQVHYNMLNGQLLVDGMPLGRLPQEIVGHPAYKRSFGQRIFDVVPANMGGVDYATRLLVHDFQIFFALRGEVLLIRARDVLGRIFELIPPDVFAKDLPRLFISDYGHWMDIGTGEVEFRPLDQLWHQSSLNWRLKFSTNCPSVMVHGGNKNQTRKLVDIRSKTFLGIAARLRPLESSENLIITVESDPSSQSPFLSVELPRFGLSFFLNHDNDLESNNMQNMVVDSNQFTGTMVGLNTQLVFRHKNSTFASLPRSRLVIIPQGKVHYSISSDKNHVCVSVDTLPESKNKVTWYKYDIDTDLGLLVGNVDFTSRLFKIYLHALCSHPLPDPLTAQRGVKHALQELNAAACFSFQQLTLEDAELLRLIAAISPPRSYYPRHLRVMQSTIWNQHLPVLSQHRLFELAVSNILQYAQSLTIFPGLQLEDIDEYHCHSDQVLLRRAGRHALYYDGDANLSSHSDKIYQSLDQVHRTSGEKEAMEISQLLQCSPAGFRAHHSTFSSLLSIMENWRIISGSTDHDNIVSLTYSKSWLHLDLPSQWLSLYQSCRQIEEPHTMKFMLTFSFASLAFNHPDLKKALIILLACANMNGLHLDDPPPHQSYDLTQGYEPRQEQLFMRVTLGIHAPDSSPIVQLAAESRKAFKKRKARAYQDSSQSQINGAVNYLMGQWPCSHPHLPSNGQDADGWLNTEDVLQRVEQYFASCLCNLQLRQFTSNVATVLQHTYDVSSLDRYPANVLGLEICSLSQNAFQNPPHSSGAFSKPFFTLEMLLSNRNVPTVPRTSYRFGQFTDWTPAGDSGELVDTTALSNLISRFKGNHHTALHQMYRLRLEESREELDGHLCWTLSNECAPPLDVCIAYRDRCKRRFADVLLLVGHALEPSTPTEKILDIAGLWPSVSPRTVLQLLASTTGIAHPPERADMLIVFAEAFMEYQYSQRLVGFSLRSDVSNFFKELNNASFDWTHARKYPDWLLIQIQGNFIARPLQSQVAEEMISPSSKENTVLQLNMGEGKSHVIVPLVAAALADSSKLVRIVVLKPLAKQMFQLLIERLAGLPNRRIFYLPFSRDVKATPENIQKIRGLFEECVRVRGVLVAQPEHILSFRLMVVDQMLVSGLNSTCIARDLQEAQAWLHSTSRDVLDESDELLHIRHQLIYTRDQQQPLDGSPDRWIVTQRIFDLVYMHMKVLHRDFPDEVELFERHMGEDEARFPHFRLLGTASSHTLVSKIAEDALNGRLDTLAFIGLGSRPSLRADIFRFLTSKNIDHSIYRDIAELYEATGLWKSLLLLRGLLAHGILVYVLCQRRWRVNYGLDPKRSLLAVPYRAKDVPSLRSEFGHPDIIVCLTCLTYYYGGLTADQVKDCFDLVTNLDNPSLEYESWVKRGGERFPHAIRHIIGVNMKDIDTFMQDVVPLFQHNKGTIDFYLSRVVFPKEAKEFPFKLGTSGWDLAETKTHFTTGFSGTNDNTDLLPTSIIHSDPVNQLRTNAQVLEYMLRPENDQYMCTADKNGQPCSAAELLKILVNQPKEIRVLLDVGAQMLEMSNQQLVQLWLQLTPAESVAAGVFFDDSDNLSVLTRDGSVTALYSSPFFQRLNECIVYLDDAHTRGTDLKLPIYFRALVTLGPKVTKDKLVQGCMRMRNLGHGQSVAFCAPPEVDRQIRKLGKLDVSASVQVVDVLSWAMFNTCSEIENHISHWVQQGIYHHRRQAGYAAFATSSYKDVKPLRTSWLEPAARDLEAMYGLHATAPPNIDLVQDIPAMRDRLRMLGITAPRDESMTEEQEREVSHELEEESQVERPKKVLPATHQLDNQIRLFVRNGIVPTSASKVLEPLLRPLSSGIRMHLLDTRTTYLLATRDFMTTTLHGQERTSLTDYLRPINWIVSHARRDGTTILVVMSPFEVNELLEDIRQSTHVRLHIYAPRVSQSMKSFDDLAFYCIPPLGAAPNINIGSSVSLYNDIGYQLDLFAGQLYFDTYEAYLRLCLLLGLSSSDADACDAAAGDRFVPEGSRPAEMAAVCLFKQSPVTLLKTLLGLRRKGMSYQSTHMGKLLQARLLRPEDFKE